MRVRPGSGTLAAWRTRCTHNRKARDEDRCHRRNRTHRVEARREAAEGRPRAAGGGAQHGCQHAHGRGTRRSARGRPGGRRRGERACVGHHVTLSVVGTDRLPESGYFRAKAAQEDLVKAGPIPYTIVRATQFFEFIGRIADSGTDGDTVRLSPALVQPEAADDVAATLADVAVGAPLNDTVELAGPEAIPLDELARRFLNASDDPRQVTADVHARYFGAELA